MPPKKDNNGDYKLKYEFEKRKGECDEEYYGSFSTKSSMSILRRIVVWAAGIIVLALVSTAGFYNTTANQIENKQIQQEGRIDRLDEKLEDIQDGIGELKRLVNQLVKKQLREDSHDEGNSVP